MSITCLPFAFARHSSIASANVAPCGWMMKSTWHVVPPNAADVCPDSTSSIVVVPPKGMSRCVCGSMQPGRTYLPLASTTRSAATSSDSPIRELRSPSTYTSPTYSAAAVMTRPPLIRTDIADLPFRSLPSALLAAFSQVDVQLVPLAAVDVDARGLEALQRRCLDVRAVRLVAGHLLQLAVGGDDLRRALVRDRIHDA